MGTTKLIKKPTASELRPYVGVACTALCYQTHGKGRIEIDEDGTIFFLSNERYSIEDILEITIKTEVKNERIEILIHDYEDVRRALNHIEHLRREVGAGDDIQLKALDNIEVSGGRIIVTNTKALPGTSAWLEEELLENDIEFDSHREEHEDQEFGPIRILTGLTSFDFWKRLRDVCDIAIERIEQS